PRNRLAALAAKAEPAPPPERAGVPEEALAGLEARLAATPLQPPSLEAGDAAAIAALVDQGRAVRAGRDLAFTATAFATARDAAVDIASAGGSVTLAQLRDRLGISRKYAQALLEAM